MRPYYSLSDHWGLTQLSTGQPFFVDKRSRDLTAWIVMGGYWETFVDDVLCALARPGDTFVDAGSNQGYYTVKIGGRVGPTGRVFAFEANPEMFAFTAENISINGRLSQDRAMNVALGAEAGQLQFCHDPNHPGGGAVLLPTSAMPTDLQLQWVPVVRLDDVLPPDTRLDLMKIDVEGFEEPVFRGMTQLLARSPDAAIVCEVSTMMWSRFGDPAELLARCAGGRRMFRIHLNGRLQEMESARLGDYLEADFVSYVLMVPDTPERMQQLQPLFDRFAPAPPLPDPEVVNPPPAPPTPRWKRALKRLLPSNLAQARR